jgi:DNA mismatch repair protein MutL
MSRIKILTESLANQIAAGEVVERPASVVKELVENALDAGATQISVQIEGAGTRMVRVIDNGCGMDPDDALLCLERHATSKLRNADDLVRLTTLGFRGEAIPSIASVSRMTITSRPAGVTLGCRIDVRFGSVLKVHEMGCAQGTVVEVADLFANVPARRKFLKSANTELAHIDEVIRSYALASFRTGFSYQVNGREVFDLPAEVDTAERRVQQALSDCPELIPIIEQEAGARTEIRVSGHLVPPGQASGRAGRLWTFVNGRYIKDRMVNHAVAEGMQGFLLKGGRAAGVVHLSLPPEGVDVNVHPTKQEVRFSENHLVHNKIVAAVWRSMEAYQEALKAQVFGPSRKEGATAARTAPAPVAWPVHEERTRFEVREPEPLPSFSPRTAPAIPETQKTTGPTSQNTLVQPSPSADSEPSPLGNGQATSRPSAPVPQGNARLADLISSPSPAGDEPEAATEDNAIAEPTPAASLRYLGQLFDTYLLCQGDDGLVAIDQHAVQERLIFEELKGHYSAATMPSQILMFPEMVELLPAEVQALAQHGPELQRLGLELQEFGGDTVVIKAVPAGLGHLPPAEILGGILSRFIDEHSSGQGGSRLDEILAGMACKAAIKAGHRLTPIEVQHLLDRMQRAGIFSHCPHGRPVLKRFSRGDIEKWFQRT